MEGRARSGDQPESFRAGSGNRVRSLRILAGCAGLMGMMTIACADRSSAGPMTSWQVTKDIANGADVSLFWDVKKGNTVVRDAIHEKNNSGVDDPAAAFAKTLFDEVNRVGRKKFGEKGDIATLDKKTATVRLSPGFEASIETKTTAGYFRLAMIDTVPPGGDLMFGKDPNTGVARLTDTGSFSINGPGLPTISFTAPSGTTGDQLASLFASELNGVAGYKAQAQGDDLFFTAPTAGTVAFGVDGNGIEYALSSVAEPSTIFLLATGTTLVVLVRRLRCLSRPSDQPHIPHGRV